MARKGRQDRGLMPKTDSGGRTIWYVRLYDHGRERRFGSFASKTAAREFYEKAKLEQKEGRFFPERYQLRGQEGVEAFIDRYLTTIKTKKSRRDEQRFAAWWKDRYRGQPLQAMTPATLEDARQVLLNERSTPRLRKEGRRTRNLKAPHVVREDVRKRQPTTVNRYFEWLRKVLNLAVRDGKLQSNPVLKLRLAKESQGKTRFLSPEEEGRLMGALGPRYAVWARLAILTGMRQTEQFSLKWADVNLERGLVTLPKTKAGDVQYVLLNDEAKRLLQGLTVGNGSVWVFPSESPDTFLDPRNFYDRIWIPAVKRAGIEWVTWHDLRHTFASRLAMAGQNEGTIAALLRHSSTALVKRYAHLSPSHLHAAVESVASFGKPHRKSEAIQQNVTKLGHLQSGTVTGTGIGDSVGEGSGVEVAEKIGAPDTN